MISSATSELLTVTIKESVFASIIGYVAFYWSDKGHSGLITAMSPAVEKQLPRATEIALRSAVR